METNDPIILVVGGSLLAMALTLFASRTISTATAQLSAEFSEEDRDLSRIRTR